MSLALGTITWEWVTPMQEMTHGWGWGGCLQTVHTSHNKITHFFTYCVVKMYQSSIPCASWRLMLDECHIKMTPHHKFVVN